MANQSKKQTRGERNTDRRCGKAPKKNPKPNDYGSRDRTFGGYSAERSAIRADKRINPTKYFLKGLTEKVK